MNRAARRTAAAVTTGLVMALVAGCAGAPPAEPEDVVLRWAWWGSDARHAISQEVIDMYEAENPHVTIEPEFSDFTGYFDKLATLIAAGDTPDIMMNEDRRLLEFAERGLLTDLTTLEGLDLGDIPDSTLANGNIDGAQYGLSSGQNAFLVFVDPQAFADAGIDIPDDTEWTWEDFLEIGAQITEASGGSVWGATSPCFYDDAFIIYARQQGEGLYNDKGELGFSEKTLTDWLGMCKAMVDTRVTPDAAQSIEIVDLNLEQGPMATNQAAMGFFFTNNLGTMRTVSGRDIMMLRAPGEFTSERGGMYLKASQYYTIAADSEHPEEAAKFLNYLENSPEAGAILLSDRGSPINPVVVDEIIGDFDPAGQEALEYLEMLSGEIEDAPAPFPVGSGAASAIMRRVVEGVLFGQMTPEQGAQTFMTELDAAIE